MDGFKLYVTNTSSIPPQGHLCYEDPDPGLPNITQTISCNQLGKYVIYYDIKGDKSYGPIVELCYVSINGCRKTFWGSNCRQSCSENCIENHCYPSNGSCIWGCKDTNCLKDMCDKDTLICTEGCKGGRTGQYCNKYNIAFNSLVSLNLKDNEHDSVASDGNKRSCLTACGSNMWLLVDLKAISIVTEVYLDLSVNPARNHHHTIYASNTSCVRENGTILYSGRSLPLEIDVKVVFRYLIYVPSNQDQNISLEVCEIGIVGCPPTRYGPFCNNTCPENCCEPCDLETGRCKFECVNRGIEDICEMGMNNTLSSFNLTCVTGKSNTNHMIKTKGIFVSVNANIFNDTNTTYFSYKNSAILEFSPTKSFISGNTTVTIKGPNIGFEGQNRYNISFCDMYNCIECSAFPDTLSSNYIKCKTGKSSRTRNMTRLQVVIDDLTMLHFKGTFRYLPDPKFNTFNRSPKAQMSGGATFTVRGEGFTNVEEVTVERVDKHCDVPEDTLAVCKTPQKLRNQLNNQTVYVHFDDVTIPVTIEYVEDPTFEKFPGVYEYDMESSIQIKGRNILNGARLEDYRIHVGLDGSCLLTDIDMQFIICFPPKSVPRTNKTDVNTVHVIVDVGNIKAYIGDLQYKVDSNILTITVGILTAALVTAVVIGGSIIRKKKKRNTKEYRMELLTREEMIREASREDN
ncbi:PLXND [Mytilus coruscus]|uniref:PLXND n=1 Tax=Mytilus coruscus TaxID=42192 RepID=A0A6J8DGK0_MYTCO|nr:PLXND [Mytilus coruscus]